MKDNNLNLEEKRYITRKNGRNIYKIRLTDEEIRNAHEYFVISWMECVLKNDFEMNDNFEITRTAKQAYDIYSEGNGLTEYEAIERAVNFKKER